MARKTKKERRRDERERREIEEQQAEEQRLKRLRLYRIGAVAVPLVTLAVSLGVYFSTDDRPLAAILAMVGMACWVPILLGLVGGAVKPRDRTRAGSIDFGNRR